MKKILALSLLLLSSLTFGATLNPIQLLNPVGSTSGQVIASTGPTTAPAWTTVTLSGLPGTVAIANGGTGQTTQAAALTALLGSSTVPLANGGTGASTAANARTNLGLGTAATVNTGTSGATIPLLNGANNWSAGQVFSVQPTAQNYAASSTSGTTRGLLFSTNANTRWYVFANNAAESGSNVGSDLIISRYSDAGTYLGDSVTITRSSGSVEMKGSTTNNNANSGSIGEYVSSSVPVGSPVALTSAVATNITSISLTAGDWDVWGSIGTNPAGTTTQFNTIGAISTTSATLPSAPNNGGYVGLPFNTAAGSFIAAPVGMTRLSLSATTTVYLVLFSSFSTSTNSGYGFIAGRRRR